jgi:phosphatidylglycerophosphate synthase
VQAVQTATLPVVVQGPANRITLTRALLSLAVALMVLVSFVTPVPVRLLVGTTVVALALDWVDGQVARRTGTVTAFGARFDMEVDAFLILVLSVQVAAAFGPWVLAIGLARYALLASERAWPWLRRPVPPRYWRKVVAAIQGVVLTVAVSGVLPLALTATALLVALLLLAESFGRDVVWLARR